MTTAQNSLRVYYQVPARQGLALAVRDGGWFTSNWGLILVKITKFSAEAENC